MKKTLIGRTETESFHINKNSFRVGIISDTQLPPCKAALKKDDTYLTHLKKALTVLKNNKADMILFAGDIGDCGTRFSLPKTRGAVKKLSFFTAPFPFIILILFYRLDLKREIERFEVTKIYPMLLAWNRTAAA